MSENTRDEPLADVVEQNQPVIPEVEQNQPVIPETDEPEAVGVHLPAKLPLEADVADAAEQARVVELDEDEYR